MKVISKENMPYWLGAVVILFVMCFVLLYFSEAQVPTNLTSSGIVAIISAVIGVVLTAFAISIQLKQQSDSEAQKDKDVKIFEKKISIYTAFTSKIWEMVYAFDVENDTNKLAKKYDELKVICFDQLVFFLNPVETKNLAKIIAKIDTTKPIDYNLPHICKITNILQNSLDNKHKDNKHKDSKHEDSKHEDESFLKDLYNAFDKKDIEIKEEKKIEKTEEKENTISDEQQQPVQNITFWHFNMWGDEQLKTFEKGKWVLNLIEYGEDWRTNLLKQVRSNDVVFLFRRGGHGYIGAFKVIDKKILDDNGYKNNTYTQEDISTFDIYNALADEDGATLVSNLIVEPIAYNFKGVGYYTVRRRTIERINDTEAVKFLLKRFKGSELDENRLAGKGKLDENTNVKLNENYFSEIIKNYNL